MVEAYNGGSGKSVPSFDVAKWKRACQEADKVLKMTHEERENIIAVFGLAEEEEEEEMETEKSLGGCSLNLCLSFFKYLYSLTFPFLLFPFRYY